MPQEAWVLKCYSCQKFQVQLKKKAKKWQCRVCNAKQDLMKIYYKGQPSDCRTTVQNMNAAEGEKMEKFLEQRSSFQNESYEEYHDAPVNSQTHDNFDYDADDFTDDFLAEIDQVEENYSQELMSAHDDYEDSFVGDTQESVAVSIQQTFESNDVFEISESENTFDTDFGNLNDHKDTLGNTVSIDQKQEVKSSIFESHCDFDESLDF